MSDQAVVHSPSRITCLLPPEPEPVTTALPAARAHFWLWGGLALAIVTLLGALLCLLYHQAQRQAGADVSNLNRILETRLGNTLRDAQSSLQGIALRMDEGLLHTDGTSPVQPWQIRALTRRFPVIARFEVFTADGRFVFSSDGRSVENTESSQRFREMLAAQRIGDANAMSMLLGSDQTSAVLYMAVPVLDGLQRHIGWVIAGQPLETLLDMVRQVDVGAHGVITLRRTDRPEAVLRVPQAPGQGRRYQADHIDRLLGEGVQEGTLVTRSRVDGVDRLYGFKRVGDFPLALVIGLAAEDYLLFWKYTVIAASVVCGAFYLLIIGLTLRLQSNRLRRQQVVDELRQSAFHDDLTGLPNRRYLLERVNQAIEECGRGQRLTLIYLDLDHFKTINDSLGHVAGDAILQRLAQRLTALRPSLDTVARLSGDEFLVLVDDDEPTRLAQLMADIQHSLRQPLELAGYNLSIAASAGLARYPGDGHDFGSLLKAADTALSQAKRNGRNTWVFYEAAMGERELRFLYIQTQLRHAFEHDALHVFYQPQIELDTGRVIGAEALLRWNHPELGPVSPTEFIAVAESSGLILPISRWLLDKVCQQAMAWQAAGLGELSVAMNCSAVQFRQGDLVNEVRRALAQSGLAPRLLELELTESILIEHSEKVLETISSLKALGVRMSIDDFGTGYSSMSYLKRFAVDKLKIDQSFVRGLLNNPRDAAIVQAVISLGHSFDIKVIAEGVETFEVLDALVLRGCDEAQGYYYARALSPMAFEAFMQERAESSCAARRLG